MVYYDRRTPGQSAAPAFYCMRFDVLEETQDSSDAAEWKIQEGKDMDGGDSCGQNKRNVRVSEPGSDAALVRMDS